MTSPDPASILLSLLSLLSQYAAESARQKESERQTLQDWLAARRHDEVRALLATNHHLNDELHTLLRGDLQHLTASISQIEAMVTLLLSRLPGFERIAQAVHPDQVLSDASLQILSRWVESGCSQLRIMPHVAGPRLSLGLPNAGGKPQAFSFADSRFVHDDMAALVSAGLVRPDTLSNGDPVFYLTRVGEKYIRHLASEDQAPDESST